MIICVRGLPAACYEIRDKGGMSVQDAATRVGVTLTAWQRWEGPASKIGKPDRIVRLHKHYLTAISQMYSGIVGKPLPVVVVAGKPRGKLGKVL